MSPKRILPAAILFALLGLPAGAIDQPDLTDGFTPPEIAAGGILGGFPLGGLDSVNPYSGKASISIPIRTVAGRGKGSHTLVVPAGYSWKVDKRDSCPDWNENCSNPDVYNNPDEQDPNILAGAIHPGTVIGRLAVTWSYAGCGRVIQTTITRFTLNGGLTLRDAATNGEPQVLGTQPGQGACYNSYTNYSRGYEFIAADGSGITFVTDNEVFDTRDPLPTIKPDGWLYYPDGRRIRVDDGVFQKIIDRNGNETIFTYTSGKLTKVTDSLNRETNIAYNQTCNSIYDCDVITWKGADGETRTAEVWYDDLEDVLDSGYSITPYAFLFTDLDSNLGLSYFNPDRVVWRVVLPDDRYYEFFYNDYGEVTKAILPTDARIEWDWESGTGSGGGANSTDEVILRRVTERRTYLDSTTSTVEGKTTYTYETQTNCQPLSSLGGWKTTVTTWDGASVAAKSATYYCGEPGNNDYEGPYDYPSWKNGRSYKTEVLDGSTVKQRQEITWKQYPLTGSLKWWTGDHEDDEAPIERPRVDTIEKTNLEVSPNLVAKQTFKYDQYNNRTDTFEYDWGGSTPIRRTHIVYQTSSSYVDAPVHLRALPLKQWICGSGTGDCTEGSAVAKTEYVFDGETLTNRSNASGHDTTNFGTSYTTRGLLTKVRRWRNQPTGKWIETVVKYDILGNPVEATDALSNTTTLSYTDDFSNASTPELGSESTYAFATTATNALSQSVSSEIDYYLGRPTKFTDFNGVETLYEFGDEFDRMTKAIEANNHASVKRRTKFDYLVPNGSNIHTHNIEVRRDLSTYADGGLYSRTFYDTLGRTVATQGDDCAMSVTTYDGAGRAETVSNPKIHESGTPGYCQGYNTWPGGQPVTTRSYDYAGRVEEVVRPGNADSDTAYAGRKVTVTDAAGKKRELWYDALGRLTSVVEDPTGSLNYVTYYAYNELDKLIGVTQAGTGATGTQQNRGFTYDSLGRLLTANNPEDNGSISYAYDDNGNLLRKVDARGVAKCFYSNQSCSAAGALGTDGYDDLNRSVVVTYSDSTPTERFCYDGKVLSGTSCVTPGTAIPYSVGRLTMSSSVYNQRQIHAFDPLGRVLSDSQTTIVQDSPWTAKSYTFAYAYNRDGSLASQTYPSGRVVNFTYDSSGRPYSVQEPSSGPSYLSAVAYTAHGGVDNLQLGNTLVEQTCYNDMLQPVARRLGTATSSGCAVQTSTDLLHLGFGYGTASANNGNMIEQSIWAPDNGSGSPWQVTQDYTYDAVNRLATAAEKLSGVTQWSRTYSYDHFGNRLISGATGHTLHMATPTSSSDIQATTNRLTGTGIAYDNAGNLTAHPNITPGSGSMAYDANNKMATFVATGVYIATKYDAAGRRVRKVYNSETTVWVYDAFGALAAEYTTETHTDEATYFRTTDHLGSTRLTTDDVGDVVARRDYFPFGERIDSTLSGRGSVLDGALVSFNSSPGMRQEFTGQQRDGETDLDYFVARNYSAPCGRMLMIDQSDGSLDLSKPQTWNRFNYANNSPLVYNDPTGWVPQYVLAVAGGACGAGILGAGFEITLQVFELADGTRPGLDGYDVLAAGVGSALGTAVVGAVPILGEGMAAESLLVLGVAGYVAGEVTEQTVTDALGGRKADLIGGGTLTIGHEILESMDDAERAGISCSPNGKLSRADALRIVLKAAGNKAIQGTVLFAADGVLEYSLGLAEDARDTWQDWFNFGYMFTYDDITNTQYMNTQVTVFGLTSNQVWSYPTQWGFTYRTPDYSVDSSITYGEVIP